MTAAATSAAGTESRNQAVAACAINVHHDHPDQVGRTLPCASFIKDEPACFYYPYGNSIPEDLFLHLDVFAPPGQLAQLSALVVGSGDLRNVLHTLAELKRKLAPSAATTPGAVALKAIQQKQHSSTPATAPSPSPPLRVTFHLNDHQPEIIARNLLILHAICSSSEPVTPALVRSIAQLWYSIALDPDVALFWHDQLLACMGRPDAEWLASASSIYRVSDADSLKQLKHVWRTWLANDWSLAKLARAREQCLLSCSTQPKSMAEYANAHSEQFSIGFMAMGESNRVHVAKIKAEAERLILHGRWFNSAPMDQLAANPSMLLTRADGSCFFSVHYGTLPMEGHLFELRQQVRLEHDMLANLTMWVECVHSLAVGAGDPRPSNSTAGGSTKSAKGGKRKPKPKPAASPSTTVASTSSTATTRPIHVQLVFNVDHCLSYMETLAISPTTRFDLIDTSNLADHCGLLNLLVNASPLLKPPSASLPHTPHIVTTSFRLGNTADTRQEYLHQMLTLDMSELPILLGLQLLEHIEGATSWGTVVQPFTWSTAHVAEVQHRGHHRFTWLACPIPTVPVDMSESLGMVEAVVKMAGEYCGTYKTKSIRAGGPMTSGALIGKLLVHALATNRISWTGDTTRAPPYHAPESFWDTLVDLDVLQGAISDVLTCAQLAGLHVSTAHLAQPLLDFVLHAQVTFPLEFDALQTPNLVVCAEYAGTKHFLESIRVLELDHKRKSISVAFYLPGHFAACDAELVTVSLRIVFEGKGYYAPMGGRVLTLDEVDVRRVRLAESPWIPVTRGIAESTAAEIARHQVDETQGKARIVKLVDSGATMSAIVDVSAYGPDFKVALATPAQVALGRGAALVSINHNLHTFWLPCRVWLKTAKIARKSLTVELVLTKKPHAFHPKAGLLGLPFHQRLHGLPKLPLASMTPDDVSAKMGFVFTEDERKCKLGLMDASTLGAACGTAFDLKESLQLVFMYAARGHRAFTIAREIDGGRGGQGLLGIILVNALHHHPRPRTAKTWTLALDVTVSVLPPTATEHDRSAYLSAMRDVMQAVLQDDAPAVVVEGKEIGAMVDMLELAKVQCGNSDEVPFPLLAGKIKNVSPAARKFLHRAILTPLSPADELVKDANVDGRKLVAKAVGSIAALKAKAVSGTGSAQSHTGTQEKFKHQAELGWQEALREMAMSSGRDPLELMAKLGLDRFDDM